MIRDLFKKLIYAVEQQHMSKQTPNKDIASIPPSSYGVKRIGRGGLAGLSVADNNFGNQSALPNVNQVDNS